MQTAKNESEILRMCHHPNIINVIDFQQDEAEGKSFLIMEFLPYQNLRMAIRIFKKENKFNESVIAYIMLQILLSCVYLHEELNIVHRDIKPTNILVSNNLTFVKLIDFGIACSFKKNFENFKENKPSMILEMMTPTGTPNYRAPEMISGGVYTEKVDIWSCGVIIKEMLRGKRARQQADGDSVPISESNEINALLKLLLRKKPKQRPNARNVLKDPWFKLYTNEFIIFPYQKSQKRTLSSILGHPGGPHTKFVNFTDNSLSPSPMNRKMLNNAKKIGAPIFFRPDTKLASIDNILEQEYESNLDQMSAVSGNFLVCQSVSNDRLNDFHKQSLNSIDEEGKLEEVDEDYTEENKKDKTSGSSDSGINKSNGKINSSRRNSSIK